MKLKEDPVQGNLFSSGGLINACKDYREMMTKRAETFFSDLYRTSPCILGEGAVIERLRRNSGLELDPFLVNAAFIYSKETREAQDDICRQYLEIGKEHDLPLLMSTPTWRASKERIARAGYADCDVNADNARHLNELRAGLGDYAEKVIVCGLMSCKGNAYEPGEALNIDEARRFHAWQAERLGRADVDVIMASTLPSKSEASGIAMALAETGKPYIISFVVRPEGTLLDGTPLRQVVAEIDALTTPQPFAYMINCSHASFVRQALLHPVNSSDEVRLRMAGLLANTAALTPEELDESDSLVEEDPQVFGGAVAGLQKELGLKILGGCCGTDDRHIRALAGQLAG